MIEKLPQGTFRESDIVAKLNELIEAFNNHGHDTLTEYGFGHPRPIKNKLGVENA